MNAGDEMNLFRIMASFVTTVGYPLKHQFVKGLLSSSHQQKKRVSYYQYLDQKLCRNGFMTLLFLGKHYIGNAKKKVTATNGKYSSEKEMRGGDRFGTSTDNEESNPKK